MDPVPVLTVVIPGRLQSANELWRLHPMSRHRVVKAVRNRVNQIATLHWLAQGRPEIRPPAHVHFLMRRSRRFDVGDDLPYACKAPRDEIVKTLGLKNDGPVLGNCFTYHQELSGKGPEELVISITLLPVPVKPARRARDVVAT